MPYVSNSGVSVFYDLVSCTGPARDHKRAPLLLVHGFMQRSGDWATSGYVDELAKHRDLILIDARGHGLSDKPHGITDYRMELLVADLTSVLDALDATTVDYMGYSFGAWVGFGMGRFAPERLDSLVLGGMHPYVRDPRPLNRRIERFTSTRDALAEGGHHSDLVPKQVRAQFEENDIEALIALTTAIRDSEGFEDASDSIQIPALIYAGEDDPAHPLAQQCVAGNENLAFLSLPGLGHMDAWHRSDLVLPHITEFLHHL